MKDTMKWYLSKGFDEKSSEYFSSGREKVVKVKANDDFTLIITFDNGEDRFLDMKPLIKENPTLNPFQSSQAFRRVYVDDSHHISWDIDPNIDSNVVWNNKVDLDSDWCYINSHPI